MVTLSCSAVCCKCSIQPGQAQLQGAEEQGGVSGLAAAPGSLQDQQWPGLGRALLL